MVDAATTTALAATAATLTSVIISSAISIWIKNQDRQSPLRLKGIEHLPTLYCILSKLIKQLEHGILGETGLDRTFSKQRIIEHLQQLEPWDSAYALILHEHSAHLLYCYRFFLYQLLDMDDHTFESGFKDVKSPLRRELIEKTRELESAVRYEVGTYDRRPSVELPPRIPNGPRRRQRR